MYHNAILSNVLVATDALVVRLHREFHAIRDSSTCNALFSEIDRVTDAYSRLVVEVIDTSL